MTRNVDLDKELDCKKRDLLRSNSDAKRVLMSYMDLYGLIANQTVASEGMVVKLEDVCHKPDARAVGCEVGCHVLFQLLLENSTCCFLVEISEELPLMTIVGILQRYSAYWGFGITAGSQ